MYSLTKDVEEKSHHSSKSTQKKMDDEMCHQSQSTPPEKSRQSSKSTQKSEDTDKKSNHRKSNWKVQGDTWWKAPLEQMYSPYINEHGRKKQSQQQEHSKVRGYLWKE